MAFRCGQVVMDAVRANRLPREIATRKAFENAIASVAATGGSTNAVLHLLAMAREAGLNCPLMIFKPSAPYAAAGGSEAAGSFVAYDVDKAGGMPVIAKRLVDGGYVDGYASPSPAGRSPRRLPTLTRLLGRK